MDAVIERKTISKLLGMNFLFLIINADIDGQNNKYEIS